MFHHSYTNVHNIRYVPSNFENQHYDDEFESY